MKTTKLLLAVLTFNFMNFITLNCRANNLTLGSTITVVSGDQISFTIKWDNSWYAATPPSNWDAVWIFVKYKDCATTDWQHAPISTTSGDHLVSGGDALLTHEMPVVNDGSGLFIRRSATGSGNIVNAETVTLKLDGISTGSYNFKVFGIEMVKILNENFQIGDGVSSSTFNNVTITSEASVSVGGGWTSDPMPAAYPKGWNAFYCMKYEIAQEQYVDFLNTLTYTQQASRSAASPAAAAYVFAMTNTGSIQYRNGIVIKTSGLATTTPAEYGMNYDSDATINEATQDGFTIACNYLSWGDLIAYLDWACLRPMTDLEFEKICRGPIARVGGEYPWGNGTATQHTSASNLGNTTEISGQSGTGLAAYNNWTPNGPMRVGFAATASTTRITASATYYGVLNMGDNLRERIVSTDANGKTYTGTLGDGALKSDGNTNLTTVDGGTWPSYSTANGSGFRGGCIGNNQSLMLTSARNNATEARTTRENNWGGGRGVR